jgi:hypothetical protein
MHIYGKARVGPCAAPGEETMGVEQSPDTPRESAPGVFFMEVGSGFQRPNVCFVPSGPGDAPHPLRRARLPAR